MSRKVGTPMRYCLVSVALLLALVVPVTARADTLAIAPSADAFVRAATPATNFGSLDYLDSHGGFGSYACGADDVQQTGAAYSYLKFDLSAIPDGAVIQSAEVQLTSRSGFAWDGDPKQHLHFVGDDSWTEQGVTYAASPGNVDQGDLAPPRFIFYGFPICGDPKGAPQLQTFTDAALTRRVTSERAGDGTMSLQVFNPNCEDCRAGPNRGYWVRFFSRE